MPNKVYDVLKYISVIVIPAVVALVSTIGSIWNLPYITETTASISAVGVFLGALIQISSSKYAKKEDDKNQDSDEDPKEGK